MLLGGTIVFFVMGGLGQFVLAFWGFIHIPVTPSLFFLGIVTVMAYEMSDETFRASQLADDLHKNEEWLNLATDSAGVGLWLWDFRTNLIFLTGHGDIPTTVQAMRRGAEDFLTKRAPKEDLLDAVKRAIDRDVRERAGRARLEALRKRFITLTPREHEVLQHVVQGKLNKQIAYDLGIHERTVKLHRTAIKTKLNVDSTAELTKLWLEFGGLESIELHSRMPSGFD